MSKEITPGLKARAHFPIFNNLSRSDHPFAYLDSASTSQKPRQVLERLQHVFTHEYANVRRGAYQLSAVATEAYLKARESVARFIGAAQSEQVVFTRGTTEGINLVAQSFPFQRGDTVLLSVLEHHSNIVPWQLLAQRAGVKLIFVDIDDLGRIDIDDFRAKLLSHKPRVVSLTHLSNALGSLSPLEILIKEAHAAGARVLIDGAQAASHLALNVDALGMDYYVFSGHKVYGPTGIGVLYGKLCALEELAPFLGGGDMIATVSLEGSTYAALPHRLEAGTPSFPEAIALASALEFIEEIGRDAIERHEQSLLTLLRDGLSEIPGVRLFGPGGLEQASIQSFVVEGVHAHDLATFADAANVQIRAGHHCTMPLMKRLGVAATARASLGVYSLEQDIVQLVQAVIEARRVLTV